MKILEQLAWRYAVREFSADKLSRTEIGELVEAVRLTPSSYGLQPYRLLVVESEEIKQRLLPYSMGQAKVRDCSHLFVLAVKRDINEAFIDEYFARTEATRKLEPGAQDGFKQHVKEAILGMPEEARRQWAEQQAYIALGNLLTVSALKNIDACPMGGFEPAGFDEVLGLEGVSLKSCVICSLGYRSENDASSAQKKVRVSRDSFSLTV